MMLVGGTPPRVGGGTVRMCGPGARRWRRRGELCMRTSLPIIGARRAATCGWTWVVAVTTPDTRDELAAGSRDVPGTAARRRERKRHRKYGATVDRVGGTAFWLLQ
eukprot:934712-Prymnesium_polylepis.1